MHVRLRVRPDKVELYERTFLDFRAKTLQNEPGCPVFELCRDPATPGLYHVFEAYADEEAIKAHTAADYYQANARLLVECLEGDHMEEIDRRGLSGIEMYALVKGIEFERFLTL